MPNAHRSLSFTLFVLVVCAAAAFGLPVFLNTGATMAKPIREFLGFTTQPPSSLAEMDTQAIQADQFFAGDGSALTDPGKWGSSATGPFNTAFVTGNTAVFATQNGTGTGAVGITVGGIRAEENFTMNSPTGTLATGGTVATVNVFSGKKLDLTGVSISTAVGTGMNKTGPGELVITTGGTYSGGFTLTDGTMTAGGVNAMGGSATNKLNLSGGKLRSGLSTALAFANTKFGGGINFSGNFEIGAPASGADGAISFANNVSLGSATRTITNSNTATTTFSGVISGASGAGLTIAGTGTGALTLTGLNTYTGPTTLSGSILATSTLANGGAASGLGASTNAAANLVFDGGTLRYLGGLVTTNRNFTINPGKTAVIDVPGTSGDLTISGSCPATTGGLTKTGTGLLNLSGQNLYSGNTTISAGFLVLVGSGSIANSPVIEIAGGAAFDVSVVTNPFSLSSGQAINASGSGSTGTIATIPGKGLTTAANSSINFSAYNGVTPPLTIQGNGTVTLASTNSVTVNTTTPLGINDYVLISKGTSTGGVNGIAPTSLTIGGSGLATGTIGSLQITGTQLILHVAADTTAATDFFRSKQTGNWSATSTWESSHDGTTWITATAVPTVSANTISIRSGHKVTVDTSTAADQIDILNGGTLFSPNANLTVNDGAGDDITVETTGIFEIGTGTLQNNGQISVKGVFQIDQGGFVASGTFNYDQTSGNLRFNNTSGLYGIGVDEVYWRAVGGPQNVDVKGAGGIDLHGTRTLNGTFSYAAGVSGADNLVLNGTAIVEPGGFMSGSPTYGPLSLLDYNTGGTYGRNGEWLPGVTTGQGYPNNVTIEAGTTLDLANGSQTQPFQIGGTLTVNSGGLTMTGSGGMTEPLTVLRNFTNTGSVTLSNQPGGDLAVGGNWFSVSGGLITNGRRVTLNGSGDQLIFGDNTFDALSIVGSTARTVSFTGGSTQAVNSDLVLTGAAGNLLNLRSMSEGTQWILHAPTQSSQNVNFVDVEDSDASGFPEVFALNSVNSMNNVNWRFAVPGTIQFSSATYSANENQGTVTITATRTGGSDGPISVQFADNTGTATGGSGPSCGAGDDYLAAGPGATFNWADGDTADKSFGLPLCNDAVIEGDETVNLVISNPMGGAALGTPNSAVLTIHDDDAPQPTVQFSAASYKGTEGSVATITVTRSTSTGTSSVDFATSGGTASGAASSCTIGGGSDYQTSTGTLIFSDGDSSKTFDVMLCKDLLEENPAETVGLTLSNPSGATLGSQSTATLNILDVANEFFNNAQIDLISGQPAATYPSTIDVSGVTGGVNGVRLSLTNVTALDAHNIEILLVDPTGTRTYRAMAAVGGNSSLGAATITLEDAAPARLPQNSAIADGQNYKPANCTDNSFKLPDPAPALPYGDPGCSSVVDTFASVFGGVNPNGTWRLYVFEHQGADRPARPEGFVSDGSIGGWGIQFLSPTAAPVTVAGRVLTAGRQGIRNAKVTISGGDLAAPMTMYTADFGYYYFSGVTAGETYFITVEPRRHTISHPTRVVNVLDSIADLDFVAEP